MPRHCGTKRRALRHGFGCGEATLALFHLSTSALPPRVRQCAFLPLTAALAGDRPGDSEANKGCAVGVADRAGRSP